MVLREYRERLTMDPMKKPPEHAVFAHIPLSDGVCHLALVADAPGLNRTPFIRCPYAIRDC